MKSLFLLVAGCLSGAAAAIVAQEPVVVTEPSLMAEARRLVAQAGEPNFDRRESATEALAELLLGNPAPQTWQAVLKLAKEVSPEAVSRVHLAFRNACCKVKDWPQHHDLLAYLAKAGDPSTRRIVARALGQQGSVQAYALLVGMLPSDDAGVEDAVSLAIGGLVVSDAAPKGKPTRRELESLCIAFRRCEAARPEMAAMLLREQCSDADLLVPLICAHASSGSKLQNVSLLSLAIRIGDACSPEILRFCDLPKEGARQYYFGAVRVLALLGGPSIRKCKRLLLECLGENEIRAVRTGALGCLGAIANDDEEARALVEGLTHDKDAGVASRALEMLRGERAVREPRPVPEKAAVEGKTGAGPDSKSDP